MHEVTVCREIMSIVERVAADNELTSVSKIQVTVGPYSCLDEQQLNFCFHIAQEDTIMEGAWITVVRDTAMTGVSQMKITSIEGE